MRLGRVIFGRLKGLKGGIPKGERGILYCEDAGKFSVVDISGSSLSGFCGSKYLTSFVSLTCITQSCWRA